MENSHIFLVEYNILFAHTHTMKQQIPNRNVLKRGRHTTKKVAIVTGSSSGIGFETSLMLAENGFTVYATMRDLSKSEKISKIAYDKNLSIHVRQLDVTNESSVDNAISDIVKHEGQIDVLVNNAGYGLVGPAEELTVDELRDQFETNLFGVLRTTNKVLPIMRKNQHGIIINLSSTLGKVGIPTMSGYVSSKFALEGLMESMRYELEPFGIKVVLVEPSVIKTNFLNSAIFAKKSLETSPYRSLIQKMSEDVGSKFENGPSPTEVANVILQAATSTKPKIRYSVGSDAKFLLDARSRMSDIDFETFYKLNFLGEKKILQEKMVIQKGNRFFKK